MLVLLFKEDCNKFCDVVDCSDFVNFFCCWIFWFENLDSELSVGKEVKFCIFESWLVGNFLVELCLLFILLI